MIRSKYRPTWVSNGNWLSSMYSKNEPLMRLFSVTVAQPFPSNDAEYQIDSLASPYMLSIINFGFQYRLQLISPAF